MTDDGGRAGIAAVALGLGGAELLGALLPHSPSLVIGIADRVIALTPATVREAVIGAVGTADKLLLAIGIVTVVLLLGLLVGRIAGPRRERRILAFGGIGLLGFVLAFGSAPTWELALLTLVAVGIAAYAFELLVPSVPAATPIETAEPAARLSRRSFVTAGTFGVLAALAGGGALVVRRSAVGTVNRVRASLHLPPPTEIASVPASATPPVPGLAPAQTPNSAFYRIDTALGLPAVDVTTWSLRVEGMVDHPFELSWSDLAALPQVQRVVTLACVSNPVGGDLVSNAVWQGVLLSDLLDRAGVQPGADQLVGESVDGFTAGFPLALARDGRDAMVAVGMNGEPLPVAHGFPARLVVPGLYGYVSATKWLSRIRLTTFAREAGFWVGQGWSADGRVAAASRIDLPHDGSGVAAGPVVVAGRAWRQHAGVQGVQVRVDDGPWQDALVATDLGVDAWRLWSFTWQATPGKHALAVRMVDDTGEVQTGAVAPTFPGAATGYDTVTVQVT